MYRADADPWQVATSHYERRKADVLLASLPRERYRRVWEPGCGVGVLTRRLAARADSVVAGDASPVATALAAERCADLDHVSVHQSTLPEMPDLGGFDLVVVAEFLYYLPNRTGSLAALWRQVEPDGHLAAVHWRYGAEDTYLSGAALHEDLARDAADRGAAHLVHHDDEHFIIDIFGERP